MRLETGFTVLEVMIAVAIVAILAAIAIPGYSDYVTRGKLTEAASNLGSQRVKLEQFYQDLRTYTGACTAGTVAPPINGKYFDYNCEIAADGQTYLIRATGKSTEGMGGFEFTIDQSNARATVSAPSGWTVQPNCWIRNKGGEC